AVLCTRLQTAREMRGSSRKARETVALLMSSCRAMSESRTRDFGAELTMPESIDDSGGGHNDGVVQPIAAPAYRGGNELPFCQRPVMRTSRGISGMPRSLWWV